MTSSWSRNSWWFIRVIVNDKVLHCINNIFQVQISTTPCLTDRLLYSYIYCKYSLFFVVCLTDKKAIVVLNLKKKCDSIAFTFDYHFIFLFTNFTKKYYSLFILLFIKINNQEGSLICLYCDLQIKKKIWNIYNLKKGVK